MEGVATKTVSVKIVAIVAGVTVTVAADETLNNDNSVDEWAVHVIVDAIRAKRPTRSASATVRVAVKSDGVLSTCETRKVNNDGESQWMCGWRRVCRY